MENTLFVPLLMIFIGITPSIWIFHPVTLLLPNPNKDHCPNQLKRGGNSLHADQWVPQQYYNHL
jgi:hypothetical protein